MFKKDLNELIICGLKDFFTSNDYRVKKNSEMIYFRKQLRNGFQHIGISSSNYYDKHYLNFGYSKRVNEIENVVLELEKYFEPNFFLTRKDTSSYYLNVTNDISLPEYIEKAMKKASDVKMVTDWIIEYSKNYAFKKFDYLDSIVSVDNEINGERFWLSDEDKPFGLHRFDVYRIVIAKLAKSPTEYKTFTEKLMEIEDKQIEQLRQSDEKNKDLKNWFVPKILGHLEEIVK